MGRWGYSAVVSRLAWGPGIRVAVALCLLAVVSGPVASQAPRPVPLVVYGDANFSPYESLIDGQPVGVELLGNVNYVKGSGPIFGFVTFTFADGSTLGVQFQGAATATANGDEASFAATLGVIGGTGTYASATGTASLFLPLAR